MIRYLIMILLFSIFAHGQFYEVPAKIKSRADLEDWTNFAADDDLMDIMSGLNFMAGG